MPRGGTSATAGRKSQLLRDPRNGHTKRVFFGQRYLVISLSNGGDGKPLITAWRTQEEAARAAASQRAGFANSTANAWTRGWTETYWVDGDANG